MDNTNTLKLTSDVITDRFTEIEIDVTHPSFFDKILKRPAVRVFLVRRACLGALICFSKKVQTLTTHDQNVSMATLVNSLPKDGRILAELIAILIADSENGPRKSLVRFLRRNLDVADAQQVLTHLLDHARIENFLHSIVFIKGMSLLKTNEMIASEANASVTLEAN